MKTGKLAAGLLAGAILLGGGAEIAPSVCSMITAQADANPYYYVKLETYCAAFERPMTDGEYDFSRWAFTGLCTSITGGDLSDEQKASVTSCEIPSDVNGEPVTEIGEGALEGCTGMTSVILPDELTSIGQNAFNGCEALTEITLPDGLTTIGSNAFTNCAALTEVLIPDSVTTIGDRAFSSCTALTSVTIPGSVTEIGYAPFGNCGRLTEIAVSDNSYYTTVDGVLYTADRTTLIQFPAGKATTYSIPDGVVTIGHYALYGCDWMTSVTVPATVLSIGTKAIGYTSLGEPIEGFVIYGQAGSVAEGYAFENSIAFNGSEVTEPSHDGTFGDINGDGAINASDAALILQYAAAYGAGYKGTLAEFLQSKKN